MMTLKVLGSSSKGNCYLLTNGNESLLIEAGIPFYEVKKACDFKTSNIVGCLISHEHGDHAGYVKHVLDSRIKVYTSSTVYDAFREKYRGQIFPLERNWYYCGGFSFMPFEAEHDCECWGFMIRHKDMGNMVFATDTKYLKYRFNGINHLVLEANYSERILSKNHDSGKLSDVQFIRVQRSHMSLGTFVETLNANDLTMLKNVVMIHLSERNSDKNMFKYTVQCNIPEFVDLYVAQKGLTINL